MDENKCICCLCGESLNKESFYKSYSDFYKGDRLPICKDCFSRKYSEYSSRYHSNKKAMQRMCLAFDVFFDEDVFDTCDIGTEDRKVVGKYFRKMNMAQYKNKTFENTLEEGFEFSGERKINGDRFAAIVDEYGNPTDGEVSEEDIKRWGVGLSPEDYENLNLHYDYLTRANPNIDNNQRIFIDDLCYAKMQQQRCVRERDMDNYKKMGDYYNSTYAKSGLKAMSDSGKNDDDCLGMWAARISQYTPEEYYKNKGLYKDYDNLGEYFERFVLRPLRNLMHGTSDRDYEFYVKDESEEDTYADFGGE